MRIFKINSKVVFFIGLALALWTTYIYRHSFIPFYLTLSIILIVVFSITLVRIKYHGWKLNLQTIFNFLFSSFSWSLIVVSLFLLSNYFFSSDTAYKQSFEIIEVSSKRGKKHHRKQRKPIVYINYYGKKEWVDFPNQYLANITNYKKVILTIQRGLFGIDIITGKELRE